jgi:hypothetical protein
VDGTVRKVRWACLFCGEARDDGDPVTVVAIWDEDGEQREQYWGAHRACLIEQVGDSARSAGGPLFGGDGQL